MSPLTAVAGLWVAWYSTWILAVVFSRRTQVQMKTDMVGPHRFLAGFGAALLFTPQALGHDHASGPWAAVTRRLWAEDDPLNWGLFGLVAAGFAFCWWARLHLGTLWSGYVTLKEGHRIIDTGPYALVRHPIYSGLIFSGIMTALIGATPLALAGACLLAIGFSMTAGIEEGFLRRELGAGAYDDYSRRVGKLVPGLK
jgi:protein-S-isoprenylcysteine O-methyltransferase Ste14